MTNSITYVALQTISPLSIRISQYYYYVIRKCDAYSQGWDTLTLIRGWGTITLIQGIQHTRKIYSYLPSIHLFCYVFLIHVIYFCNHQYCLTFSIFIFGTICVACVFLFLELFRIAERLQALWCHVRATHSIAPSASHHGSIASSASRYHVFTRKFMAYACK